MNNPAPEQPAELVARLRATFRAGKTKPVAWRTGQLQRMRTLLTEQGETFAAALHADLGKSSTEAYRTEIDFVIREIDHTLEHLDGWLRPEPAPVPAFLGEASAWTQYDPLGVVLVIAPWNYPASWCWRRWPVPSPRETRWSPSPANWPRPRPPPSPRLVPQYLDTDAVAVVEGGVPETTALLEQRFDHILYTGNGTVGRIVMAAAARHLTPVTLELGGKSPAFVDRGTDLDTVAARLAAGQVPQRRTDLRRARLRPHRPRDRTRPGGRAGQVRGAPDGPDASASPEYGRIVNERHFDRLTALLASGRQVTGGAHDRETKYIAPTVLAEVSGRSRHAGGDLRPDPPDRRGGRARRGHRLHQRPRQAAGPLRVHRLRHHPGAARGRNLLGRPRVRPAAGPSHHLRPAVRGRRRKRHGQLPRPATPSRPSATAKPSSPSPSADPAQRCARERDIPS